MDMDINKLNNDGFCAGRKNGEFIHQETGIEFVYVPPCNGNDEFLMGKYPVTNKQWYMLSGGVTKPCYDWDCPVVYVTPLAISSALIIPCSAKA